MADVSRNRSYLINFSVIEIWIDQILYKQLQPPPVGDICPEGSWVVSVAVLISTNPENIPRIDNKVIHIISWNRMNLRRDVT